jgi:hypothetical protein
MSTTVIIGFGILGWVLVAILTALVAGKIVRRRDEQRPGEAGPIRPETSVPGRATSKCSCSSPTGHGKEQVSFRHGRC